MSYPRRHTRITYEGMSFLAILVFIVLGSILRQINLLVLLSGLMIAPFFFNWRISMKMLERVSFRREMPSWVHAGEPCTIQWRVSNDRTSVSSWEIRINDRVDPGGEGKKRFEEVDVILPQIIPGETVHGSYRCLMPLRGVYDFGPAVAISAFPVGLIRTKVRIKDCEQLIVAPSLGRLTDAWTRLTQSSAVGLRSSQRTRGASDDEFYAIRAWKSGDSTRKIHWRSTAKRGELLVKQFDQRTDRQYAVLLDFYGTPESNASDCELAASFMATVVRRMEQKVKGHGAVAIFGRQSAVYSQRLNRFLVAELMSQLATLQPTNSGNTADQIAEFYKSLPNDTTLIAISTRPIDAVEIGTDISRIQWIDVSNGGSHEYFEAIPSQEKQLFDEIPNQDYL